MNKRCSAYLGTLFLAVVGGGYWGCGRTANEESGTPASAHSAELVVKAVSVARRDWIAAVPITGTLRSLSTVEIKPEVGGRLIATYFQEGDLVGKDQLLAEIDPANYRLAYDQAAAALQVALAGLDRAKISADHAGTEKERADNLLKSGGITEKDHQAALTGVRDADSQVRLAEAQCAQARAAVAIAEKALGDCKIYSPTEGHIQKRHFDRGSLVSPGAALYTIVDNNQLELECVIPSYQLAKLKLGQRATFKTPTYDYKEFEGIVSAINPEIESENRSVTAKLKIANPRGELRSGMYARGEIITNREPKAIVIPRDSLIAEKEISETASVYVVRNGVAQRVKINIGDSQNEAVLVRQGLQEGDLVISEIGPSLKDGVPVRISK